MHEPTLLECPCKFQTLFLFCSMPLWNLIENEWPQDIFLLDGLMQVLFATLVQTKLELESVGLVT